MPWRCGWPHLLCGSASDRGSDPIPVVQAGLLIHLRLKEVDVGAAIHLAFQELEAVDLTLGLPVRPRRRECGSDGGVIGAQAASE